MIFKNNYTYALFDLQLVKLIIYIEELYSAYTKLARSELSNQFKDNSDFKFQGRMDCACAFCSANTISYQYKFPFILCHFWPNESKITDFCVSICNLLIQAKFIYKNTLKYMSFKKLIFKLKKITKRVLFPFKLVRIFFYISDLVFIIWIKFYSFIYRGKTNLWAMYLKTLFKNTL